MYSPEIFGIAFGLFMALGIFALKTAVGNYYFLALPGRSAVKAFFLILMQAVYAAVFLIAFEFLKKFDFFRMTDATAFLKNGVIFHLLLCAGLIYWGIRLLIRPEEKCPDRIDSKGWLLLTVPCPVCASAIFLVCAFALMLFPGFAERLCWMIPAAFFLMNLFFLGILAVIGKMFRIQPLILTGRMMILIAVYFILILLIAPQFQAAGKLYAIARAGDGGFSISHLHMVVVLLAGIAALGGLFWNVSVEKRG
ncbi:MAG: hypothetical protein J5858_00260 [Lentisphaeria bacterium]|nr:hypothetical protein [Lentisphaeria bacterium]